MSTDFKATRFACSWPWSTLVLLSDGRVVCGCADPYASRVLGDARHEALTTIWTGTKAAGLRRDLNGGGARFCGDCPLKQPLAEEVPPPNRPLQVSPLPSRLFVECTAACNVSCLESCCAPETGITRTRQAGMLDFDLFCRVVDEASPALVRIDLFNYGETFLHKRAVEMCEYVKGRYPQVYLYTSTNGMALNDERSRRLARSGIDEVTFSIDGATQETYERYRRRGRLDVALANLRAMADEKRQNGLDVPVINWRYILFSWNDGDAEMDLARRLAEEHGADRLSWEVTDHPESAFSRRFAPGTKDHEAIRHEIWDTSNLGNAIPGATPRASIRMSRSRGPLPLVARRDTVMRVVASVRNVSTRPFAANASYGRRLVRLGAQLCKADGRLLNRDHARAWLPRTLLPGRTAEVPIDVPVPAARGRYQVKFDLVSEGIDWFEACGSQVLRVPLWVW